MIARSLLILLVSATPLLAQPNDLYTPPTAPPPLDPVGLLLRLVFLTTLTLTVCGAGVLWARRLGRGKPTDPKHSGRIVHDGSLALDGKSTLHTIRVDGQKVIVAVDGSGLRSLTILSEPFDAVLAEEVANTANRHPITE